MSVLKSDSFSNTLWPLLFVLRAHNLTAVTFFLFLKCLLILAEQTTVKDLISSLIYVTIIAKADQMMTIINELRKKSLIWFAIGILLKFSYLCEPDENSIFVISVSQTISKQQRAAHYQKEISFQVFASGLYADHLTTICKWQCIYTTMNTWFQCECRYSRFRCLYIQSVSPYRHRLYTLICFVALQLLQ